MGGADSGESDALGDEPTLIRQPSSSRRPPASQVDGPASPPDSARLPEVSREVYAVAGEFAHGGIGRILRARDLRLDRPVALKELIEPGGPGETRFVSEALVTARLQHPSIVPVYEAGRWPTGEPFYAMKLVSGRPLSSIIADAPTLEERLALLPHVLAVVEAVAYAHSERIIHRDLKPANVLIGDFGEAVVIDWGLAKDLAQEEALAAAQPAAQPAASAVRLGGTNPSITMIGTVMGTPAYMPPEQAAALKVDERADVYALGAMLYHLLAGAQPYEGTTSEQILQQVITSVPPPLAQRQKGIPEELLAIVSKAMARAPADRYPTARELAEDLRRFQAGQLVGAKRYSPWDRLRRFVRRHRAMVAMTTATLFMVGTMGAMSVRRIVIERDRAEVARREAVEHADERTLVLARDALDRDPNRALADLRSLSSSFQHWGAARVIAADARSRGLATILRGHSLLVGKVAFSPDGKLLATASDDRTVRVWRLEDGTSRVFSGHTDEVWWVTFSPDGTRLASSGKDRTIRLWDVATGTSRVFSGHEKGIPNVYFTPDGRRLVSGGKDGTVRIWDLEGGKVRVLRGSLGDGVSFVPTPDISLMATVSPPEKVALLWDLERGESRLLAGHEASVRWAAVSPRGDLVATGGRESTIRLWQLRDGNGHALPGHKGNITGLAFSPDGRSLASSSRDRTVRLWDLATGTAQVFPGHKGWFSPVAFSPDGRHLASGGQDRIVRLWNLTTGQERTFLGCEDAVRDLAFSPDGQLLAAGVEDGTVRLFRVDANASRVLVEHQGAVSSLDVSPDGSLLVSAGADGVVRLSNPRDGELAALREHGPGAVRARLSPDGSLVASSGLDGTVRLWTLAGQLVRVLGAPGQTSGQPPPLTFSPDGRLLATTGEAGTVRLWGVGSGWEQVLAGHTKPPWRLTFSPDGRRLASGGEDGTVRLWEVTSGEGQVLGAHDDDVRDLAFSPDGRRLVSGSADHSLKLWDLEGGGSRRVATGGLGVRQVGFSRDGKTVFSISEGEVVVSRWDAETGAARGLLRGHEEDVLHTALSPDGTRLVTASADMTVRLWDLESGESRVLNGHGGSVTQVAFSPDGTWLVSASEDGTVRLWPEDLPLEPAALRAWLTAAE